MVSSKSPSETNSRPVQATDATVTAVVDRDALLSVLAQAGTSPASAIASIPRAVGMSVEPRLMTAEETTAALTTGLAVTGAGSTAL